MGYKFDPHVHTIISSECGRASPSELAGFYKERGYGGIAVTDHFFLGNTCIPRDIPWEAWVEGYCRAYREVKKAGDLVGMDVFFGWESTYASEDFLVYGLDEAWLKAHPEVVTWDQREQYEHIHAEGGYVVQAHPFRERTYMTEIKIHPYHAAVWEIANAGNEPYMDRLAMEEARKYDLPVTAGSDLHRVDKLKPGSPFGIDADEPIRSIEDYGRLIEDGTGYRLIVPEDRFDCEGMNPYFKTFLYTMNHQRTEVTAPFYPEGETAGPPRN